MTKLGNIVRDNIWQFIGVVASVVVSLAIFGATLYFTSRDKPTKAIEVVILTQTSVMEIHQSLAQDIVCSYRGQETADLSLIRVKLESTGNEPIRKADYESPITFIFPEPTTILEAKILVHR
jgi:hypothetical protein